MTQKYWEQQPVSFGDTVRLVKNYVKAEVIKEAEHKQLYYHNFDHALAVERRAIYILQAIKPVLLKENSLEQLSRLESLISVCGLAHDMVQIFESTPPNQSRKRRSGLSETESAEKVIRYIARLNQALAAEKLDSSFQFSEEEQQLIRDGIIATICVPDPQGSKSNTFSGQSIYQPYLYDIQQETSIVGRIIALADLGALGIDGTEEYISDGILIFLEDNPHLIELVLNCDRLNDLDRHLSHRQNSELKTKLLTMTRFTIDFARERLARFEPEIAGFSPPIRQIIRDRVFVHLNQKSINLIENTIPSHSDTSFSELSDFFNSSSIKQSKRSPYRNSAIS